MRAPWNRAERPSLTPALGAAVLALVAAAASVKKLHDPDLFWHLRQGAWLLDRGPIPFPDPFSHGAEIPWRGVDWGTDVLFSLVERAFGFAGLGALVAFGAAAFAALLFLLARRSGASVVGAVGIGSLATAASLFRLEPKSDLSTFLAVAGWALLRETSGRVPERLLGTVGLVALGSLFHRGAVVLVGLTALTALHAHFAGDSRRARFAWVSVVASTGALVALWPEALSGLGSFELLGRGSYARTFAEWAPPSSIFFGVQNVPFTLLLGLSCLGLLVRRTFDERALVAVALLALGLRAVRFVPLACIGLVPLAVPAARWVLRRLDLDEHGARLRALITFSLPCLVIGGQFVLRTPSGLVGFGVLDWRMPVDAARFLRAHPPEGRLYNAFLFGGYLMYALPERTVFVDGRNDLAYTDAFFRRSIASGRSPDALLRLVDEELLDVLVLRCSKIEDEFVSRVLEDGRFSLVHLDDVAAVLVRDVRQRPEYLARHAYRELDPGTALSALGRPVLSEGLIREVFRYREAAPNSLRARLFTSIVAERSGDDDTAAEELARAREMAEERGIAAP